MEKQSEQCAVEPSPGRPGAACDTECGLRASCAVGRGGCLPKELKEHFGKEVANSAGCGV